MECPACGTYVISEGVTCECGFDPLTDTKASPPTSKNEYKDNTSSINTQEVTQKETTSKTNEGSWLFPDVSTIKKSIETSRQGVYASIFVAIATAIVAYIELETDNYTFDAYNYIDTIIYSIIAWRIYKMSVAWSITGLAIYIISIIILLIDYGELKGLFMKLIIISCFVNSIRGTKAYRKLNNKSLI